MVSLTLSLLHSAEICRREVATIIGDRMPAVGISMPLAKAMVKVMDLKNHLVTIVAKSPDIHNGYARVR